MGRVERAFWDLHSRNWDDSLADDAVAAHVVELARLLSDATPPDAVVVDLGCGTGNHAATLGAIGVDSSVGMLRQARRKGVTVVRADLDATLPLRTASLDGAVSVYVAQFLDLPTFLAEIARVLKPGGSLVIEVPRPDRTPRDRRQLSRRYRAFQRLEWVVAGIGLRAGRVQPQTDDDLTDAARRAGFAVVETRATNHSHVAHVTLTPNPVPP